MKPARLLIALAALGSGACVTLPDVGRGQIEAKNGQFELAEKDFRPLAERGYTQAQLGLANLYAARPDPKSLAEAAKWYRAALPQQPLADVPLARTLIASGGKPQLDEAEGLLKKADADRQDPGALAQLVRLYIAHPEQDKANEVDALSRRAEDTRNAQIAAAVAGYLRETAEMTDHHERLITLCASTLDRVPACYGDLALNDRAQGQDDALKALVAGALSRYAKKEVPGPPMMNLARALVDESEVKGHTEPQLATDILHKVGDSDLPSRVQSGRLLTDFPFLDPDADAEKILLDASKENSPEADYYLGRMYLTARRTPRNPGDAQMYLERAARTLPLAHYLLGRLYEIGYLGDADPDKAVSHLVAAARGGVTVADVGLAKIFSDAHGVKPDLVNAYVFAKFAVLDGATDDPQFFVKIQDQMTPPQVAAAEALWEQEDAARKQVPVPAAPPGDPS